MGCCPSTHYNPTPPYSASNLPTKPSNRSLPRPPPFPDDVKETVKEVLTETQPTPPPPQSKNPIFDRPNLVKDRNFHHRQKPLTSNKKSNPHIPQLPLLPSTAGDVPEYRASEICSHSESIVSTAEDSCSSAPLKTTTTRKDGHRSNSAHSHSPAKKPQARTQSPGSTVSLAARKNVRRMSDQSPVRRAIPEPARVVGGPQADPGERSGRRSRSPARRVGRTDSGRMTDAGPGRMRRRNGNGEELIENPLVSLECFIFL